MMTSLGGCVTQSLRERAPPSFLADIMMRVFLTLVVIPRELVLDYVNHIWGEGGKEKERESHTTLPLHVGRLTYFSLPQFRGL